MNGFFKIGESEDYMIQFFDVNGIHLSIRYSFSNVMFEVII